jgi:hypothetical protein
MVAFIVGYIGYLRIDRNHWKHKAEELQLVINQALSREEALQLGNAAITKKYEGLLAVLNLQEDKYTKLLQEKISNDKELNSLRISYRALRLFNESKRDPAAPTTTTLEGNDAKANSSEASSNNEGSVTLATVFKQVAENDGNHWKCVHQVEQWQTFWKDFESNYTGAMEGK